MSRDTYCADGVIADGERIVRAGGIVKYARMKWHHEKLEKLVGERVHVYSNDYWEILPFATYGKEQEFVGHLSKV